MKSNKGFTLIELAVVLAIIAVLAAVLTPMVSNYIDQARVSRAMADATTVAQAFQLYKKDTGYYPVYSSLSNAKAGTTDADLLVSVGTAPSVSGSVTGWSYTFAGTTTANIVTRLNTALSGMTSNDNNPGKTSFRGPYIGSLDSDPWGNMFVVAVGGLISGSNHAFVISGGPNGRIDINETQANSANLTTVASSTDDIVAAIK